mmetsp:Transcript_77021/g.222727  ORF Transcript_77021/g.222727 Transcript_77021/m.222727 type:complete len:225 (-) Transcript_77021:70-744(-)
MRADGAKNTARSTVATSPEPTAASSCVVKSVAAGPRSVLFGISVRTNLMASVRFSNFATLGPPSERSERACDKRAVKFATTSARTAPALGAPARVARERERCTAPGSLQPPAFTHAMASSPSSPNFDVTAEISDWATCASFASLIASIRWLMCSGRPALHSCVNTSSKFATARSFTVWRSFSRAALVAGRPSSSTFLMAASPFLSAATSVAVDSLACFNSLYTS